MGRDVYVVDVRRSPYAKIQPVPLNRVQVVDSFWRPRLENLSNVALVHQFKMLEETGRIDNFRRASGRKEGGYIGRFWFNDSDVYKVIEASAYSLTHVYNEHLYKLVVSTIADVATAQEADGYLNTYIRLNKLERWRELQWSHELYCAGHLIQAGIATKRALGYEQLITVATRFADLIADTFGWGKLEAADGHPEVELALVELYRETGRKSYLDVAKFFVDFRGQKKIVYLTKSPTTWVTPEYLVDHANIRFMEDFAGSHAVRALYLFAGATDLYLELGEEDLLNALQRLWRKTLAKMYITGGLGSRYEGEAFGEDYELPNDRAYAETCAAVAGVMWAWRMFLATGYPEYIDTLETILYNAALAGISLDGTRYFYVNPLADYNKKHERQPWFECACCPPNIARLIAWVPEMIYAISKREPKVWINLFIGSTASVDLHGNNLEIMMRTSYPWNGDAEIEVYPEKSEEFSIMIRVPRWAHGAKIKIKDRVFEPRAGEYHEVRSRWDRGDVIEVYIPTKPRAVKAHPWIESAYGKIAIARGPLVYCVEEVDNNFDIRNLVVDPKNLRLVDEYRRDLLGGIVVIKGEGYVLENNGWQNIVYRDYIDETAVDKAIFSAIPYYAWNNRGRTRMNVWIKSISIK